LRNASRLDVEPGSGLGGAGGLGASGFVGVAAGAFGFSAVHFGGGGLAGLPQENKNPTTNSFTLSRKTFVCSLIETTFPAPSRAVSIWPIVKDC
jgi:hypothetical protein